MKQNVVSFRTAKMAKEVGFDLMTMFYYDSDNPLSNNVNLRKNHFWCDENGEHFVWCDNRVDEESGILEYKLVTRNQAPEHAFLQQWLREIHHLWVEVLVFGDGVGTQCTIKKANPDDKEDDQSRIVYMEKMVDTGLYTKLEFDYNKTLELGLQAALNLLNEK